MLGPSLTRHSIADFNVTYLALTLARASQLTIPSTTHNVEAMADSDNISDITPVKRRKTTHQTSNGKAWNEDDDSGDDLFGEHETIATLPVTASQRPQQLGYSSKQLHNELASLSSSANGRTSSPGYVTQPTQALNGTYVTQPTQPLESQTSRHFTQSTQPLKRNTPTDDVQVMRSSPPAEGTESQMPPPPIRRAPFAKPSLLASAMAPPGTAFRRPVGVQQKTPVVNLDDDCLLYTSPSPRDGLLSRMPSSA